MNNHQFIGNHNILPFILFVCFWIFLIYSLLSQRLEPRINFNLSLISLIFKTINFSLSSHSNFNNKCKICNFIPYKGGALPNSSEKDLIMSFGTNKLTNLFPFIRTLRTTGSRCRFILFVDANSLTKYPNIYYELANDCGVEFINIGSISFTKMQAMFLRFCFFQKFLITNQAKIDRVIFVDLYDTIFQHDPFTTEFGNFLYISSDTYSFRRVRSNLNWLNECLTHFDHNFDPTVSTLFSEDFKKEVVYKEALNGGLQAGPVQIMIEFSTAMMKMGDVKTLKVHCNDQGFLNALIYSGYFNRMFRYSILSLNSTFMASIHFFCFQHINKSPDKFEIGKIDRYGGVAAVLHQFDRSRKLKSALVDVCPNDNNFDDYTR